MTNIKFCARIKILQAKNLVLQLEVGKMKKNIAIIVVEVLAIIVLSFFEGMRFQLLACFMGICLGISIYNLISQVSIANRKYRIFKRFYREFVFAKNNSNGFNEPIQESANVVLRAQKEINHYERYLTKKKADEIAMMSEQAKKSIQ